MPKVFKPREYQEIAINFILDNPRCAVWLFMGAGKTAVILTILDMLKLAGFLEKPVLILAPLRVAQTTWPAEVEKWSHTEHLKLTTITGDKKARAEALKTPADIYTMNYDNIAWLIETLNGEWPFGTIVADESTKLKGFRLRQGAKRAQVLSKVAHKSDRFINLTGTPAPNGLIDLWGQTWFLDGGARLGRTFTAFVQRWFQKSFNGYDVTPLAHSQKQIEDKLRDICLSLNPEDYFDIEDPIENTIEVELPPEARKNYRDMEKLMFAELDDIGVDTVEAVNAASRTMKCLQIANGAAYINEERTAWKQIHDVKLKALEEVIEEAAGMPVLVAYHFKSDLERLSKHFKKGRVLDKNPKTIEDWNKGKIPILFAHPQSAGHGLNLQDGGNILCFFSISWNLEHHEQIIERIGPVRQKQAGYDRPVFLHYILAKDTVEELVLARLRTKASIQQILMEAMELRETN